MIGVDDLEKNFVETECINQLNILRTQSSLPDRYNLESTTIA